jgi:hypothetical protein
MTSVILTAADFYIYGQNSLPPAAPVRDVTDDYFGTKITDPYRSGWKNRNRRSLPFG